MGLIKEIESIVSASAILSAYFAASLIVPAMQFVVHTTFDFDRKVMQYCFIILIFGKRL